MEIENGYWCFIEKYLPNYYSNDLVLESDILWRYIEDDDVCKEDREWIKNEFNNKQEVLKEIARIETLLFSNAIRFYCSNFIHQNFSPTA